MKAVAAAYEAKLADVQAKFFRLLETNRNAPDFERLFREVDAALDELSRVRELEDAAV